MTSGRCVIDRGRHPRPAAVGRVCAYHWSRLERLLDPAEQGQAFPPLDGRRVPPSIPVAFASLELRVKIGEKLRGGSFRSSPPGDLTVIALRDPRSQPDPDGSGPWSALGVLAAIVQRLRLDGARDIHGQPVAGPGPSVAGHCAWLATFGQHLAAADWVADAFADLDTLHRQLLAAVGDPAPSPVGRCLKVDEDGQRCGTPLWLPEQPPRETNEAIRTLRCPGCDHTYSDAELARLARGQRGAEPAA